MLEFYIQRREHRQRTICGNWTLDGFTGGFWIWPEVLGQSEKADAQTELEQPVEVMLI